jgi:2-oxoglutarate dehydrogenase E1 component
LDRLTWSDSFERFVASKYPSEKRFGLEGGETLIPGMKAMVSGIFFGGFFLKNKIKH